MKNKSEIKTTSEIFEQYPVVEEGGECLSPPEESTKPRIEPMNVLYQVFVEAEQQLIKGNAKPSDLAQIKECKRIAALNMSRIELITLAASLFISGRESDAKFQELHYQLNSLLPSIIEENNNTGQARSIVESLDASILDGLKYVLRLSDEMLERSKVFARSEVAKKGAQGRLNKIESNKKIIQLEYVKWREDKGTKFSKSQFAEVMIKKYDLKTSKRTITESWLKEK